MQVDERMNWRLAVLTGVAAVSLLATLFIEPIAQDPAYYDFADERALAGLPNYLNVLSNAGFLIVGVWGLFFVFRHGREATPTTRPAWLIFFVGIAATAIGSSYFHWSPSTETLVWDRLPMTIGFMSFVSIVIAEYFSPPLARRLLVPLLIVGLASVAYWACTESLGRGDLRPYALVQFLPMLLIPLVLLLYRGRSDLAHYIWWMIGFYLLAKLAEFYDAEILSAAGLISGHSLKHLFAALAPAALLLGLVKRRA